ncbi:YkvI family membrane protein [Glutamicibacter sp. AOP12-B1-11]|uniref:YkvI family membrane protein n=1 Tax=Glutamicibacter sp. AOP12-B1-11 TaxID=3457725 RepID=UPI004034E8D2
MSDKVVTRAHLATVEKGSFFRVLTYAGAIMAFLIGSGFATGQEILQYFTSYGYWGVFGTGLLVLVLMTYVAVEFFVVGQAKKYDRPSHIFRYYCGKHLGYFFDFFSILFVFLSFTVMVAGAGAVFEEHYGLSKFIGGIGLAVAVGISVWFGLKSLVDVIGKIGPLVVVVAIGLGLLAILRNPAGISEGHQLLPGLDLIQASTNWFMAGLSYVGFCMLWLAAFLTALGKTARSRKEAVAGGITGAVVFSLACVVVGLGLLANITRVGGTEIPMLVLAKDISPVLAAGISVMILAGIYTTAVPLLWTVSSRFFADKTLRFKYLTITLAVLGTVIGLMLPFSQMVNVVYVINGYVGVLLLALMVVKTISRVVRRHPVSR